jgi:5-hydroxyisourate hydrolase
MAASAPPAPSQPPTKDRITCHVLDTTKGQPARGVRVKLELISHQTPPQQHGHAGPSTATKTFESRTDDDGRVNAWLPYSSPNSSGEVPVYTLEDVLGDVRGRSLWTLRFDTGAYFAAHEAETFFPEVAVTFAFEEGQHYHVPLLLAPYSYSTYRGS